MLQDFLTKNREILIDRCRLKVATRRAPRADEQELAFGIPLFLDQLIGALRLEQSSGSGEAGPNASDRASAAARHGSELLRRGFTVGQVVHAALADLKLVGWPKTSGKRGLHVYVRIEQRWTFDEVRRAALALAREVERRAPQLATSKWWKEERHGVFVDYNQNAKDRTVAAAYSVRPTPDATVSAPLSWDEVSECDPADFTLVTMEKRFKKVGDRHAGIDKAVGSIAPLLELFDEQGLGDAPWPPHYKKQRGEPARVQPSKRKHPLIEIGRARHKDDALAGLERWKERHREAAAHLAPADVLVDAMRGRYTTWTRIRVNLKNVPEKLRPPQEPLDPDEKIFSSS